MEIRSKRLKGHLEAIILQANRFTHAKEFDRAIELYTKVLEESGHPAAYLNRAQCYAATLQPWLAVNDSLRAYIMGQAVLDAINEEDMKNHQTGHLIKDIRLYAEECRRAIRLKEAWCDVATDDNLSNSLPELSKMTLLEDLPTQVKHGESSAVLSAILDLTAKALFRLTDALVRCGSGPAYTALQILDDVFHMNIDASGKHKPLNLHNPDTPNLEHVLGSYVVRQHCFPRVVMIQLQAVADTILDVLLENATLASALSHHRLLQTRFSVFPSGNYGFVERQDDYVALNIAISSVDANSVVGFSTPTDDVQSKLVATEDAYEGTVLFTERLPYVVSTQDAADMANLTTICDACGAYLQIPSPFIMRVLAQEARQEEAKPVSPSSVPDTPPRGMADAPTGIFETADIQVCRSGNAEIRENVSFCSYDCRQLAMDTYHDSTCGSHIEDYLRQSILQVEPHIPDLPDLARQKMILLLLSRLLSRAYMTSTAPLDLLVVQLLFASSRHEQLQDQTSVPWSFYNNVLRPFQMLQAMDGRTDAPKTVRKSALSDGRVLNTLISLIQSRLYADEGFFWTKTYDDEGYHEQTLPYEATPDQAKGIVFGRLHPLCDLVPIASKAEQANVEFVDLGDGSIVCLPLFSNENDKNSGDEGRNQGEKDDVNKCIPEGTPLFVLAAKPRMATSSERETYVRKDDYGEGGTMMDVDVDGAHVEMEHDEPEEGEIEGEEEFSGYVDEESYGGLAVEDEMLDDVNAEYEEMDLDF